MTGRVNTPRLVVAGLARRPLTWLFHSLLLGLVGRLRLADNGEKGLFFVLDRASARITQRIDG